MRLVYILFLIAVSTLKLNAQVGGESTFRFLDLPSSARQAALGGNQISVFDNDLDMVYHNPSLLNDSMHNRMAFNYVSHLGGIKYGYAAYSRSYDKIGSFAVAVHYVDYGEFLYVSEEMTKPDGTTFGAKEYAYNISYSRRLHRNFNVGATLKPVYSALESYKSFGMMLDVGGTYISNNKNVTASLLFKNIGGQITTYYEGGERESVPFDIQAGMSMKLKHAPIRFLATARHLTDFDLLYKKKEEDDTNLNQTENNKLFDKVFNHFTIGAEFFPIRNFTLRFGYNHLRKEELSIEETPSTVGLSWGFGFKISKFNLNYGSAKYHLAGSANLFSVSVNLSEFAAPKKY